jgi:hypothetical protein
LVCWDVDIAFFENNVLNVIDLYCGFVGTNGYVLVRWCVGASCIALVMTLLAYRCVDVFMG